MKNLSVPSRIIISVTSLVLIVTYFVPLWRIDLFAPQYPEGLVMKIWLTRLTGDVDIINGLNHYIGMKKISASMFPEFSFMVYLVAAFILYGLLISITGSRKILFSYLVVSFCVAALAVYDFYQWGYDYGHNLDPHAPIKVPGMGYQPPLLGHKKLLNFDAYSTPDIGGFILIGAVIIAGLIWFVEFKKKQLPMKNTFLFSLLIFLGSCQSSPEPIILGVDVCAHCKMPIADPKFGAELITKKGKIYKFDDIVCLQGFSTHNFDDLNQIKRTLVVDYEHTSILLDAEHSSLLKSDQLRTPMNGGIASFLSRKAAESHLKDFPGTIITWSELHPKTN